MISSFFVQINKNYWKNFKVKFWILNIWLKYKGLENITKNIFFTTYLQNMTLPVKNPQSDSQNPSSPLIKSIIICNKDLEKY